MQINANGLRNVRPSVPPTIKIAAAQLTSKEDEQATFPPKDQILAAHLMTKSVVKVNITYSFNSKKYSEGKHTLLQASLPNKWLLNMMSLTPTEKRIKRQNREVLVRIDDVAISDNDQDCVDEDSILQAFLAMPPPRKNIDNVKECQRIAMHNLRTVVFKKLSGHANDKTSDVRESIVEVGTKIMIRLQSHIGISSWIEALVEMRCQDTPNRRENSFIVTWHEGGEHMSSSRLLNQYNRGVGREWCTVLDWHSFTALPLTILDALALESWFDYKTYDGKLGFGEVCKRVGAGLNGLCGAGGELRG